MTDNEPTAAAEMDAEAKPPHRLGRPPATEGFMAMSTAELIEECRKAYEREGIGVLSFQGLKRHKLYYPLYAKGLKQADVLAALGLDDAYREHREEAPRRYGDTERLRWTWKRILATARNLAEQEGSLPPAAWFQANGYGSLVAAIYVHGKTWGDLRGELGDFSNSNFVESRNGLRWLSHAEASLSNFLHARGIEHRKGGKYPDEYAAASGFRYGIYDLTFLASDGRWIDVEVWGDKPLGQEEEYAAKRALKEAFNQGNQDFLGIHFQDCYREERLTEVLESYIGRIEAFRFDRPTDPLIHSTHWSNADELLAFARRLAASMPDGKFPTEEWLRKRGKFADRPGEPHNTLSVYIKTWLGGIRNLRRLLDQEHASTREWTREKAIAAYKDFHDRHGFTPEHARHRFTRKGDIPREVYLEGAIIDNACRKYAGGTKAVRELLGIGVKRNWKWSRDKIVAETRAILSEYGLSPSQLLSDHRQGDLNLLPEVIQHLTQLTAAAGRHNGGMTSVLRDLGFKRPSRYRRRSKPAPSDKS